MNVSLVIRPEAELDLAEAYDWYERQRDGLGAEFLLSVEASLEAVRRSPLGYTVVHCSVRRAMLRRFPYGVFYFIDHQEVVVLAVFHCKRDPSTWQSRS